MSNGDYRSPGVYTEEIFFSPSERLQTGVPVFMGLTEKRPEKPDDPGAFRLFRWSEFEQKFGAPVVNSYLPFAVRGFFENGGQLCYVVPIEAATKPVIDHTLSMLESWDDIDLICAPDIMTNEAEASELQQLVIHHCDKTNDRLALLDSLPNAGVHQVLDHRNRLKGTNVALYFPWIRVTEGPEKDILIPPCGHIAGIYARSDRRIGVHKAPANEIIEGVLDLGLSLTKFQQDDLNPKGINCLRIFEGRGIRVWGARTLSHDPAWTYVNVRRLFLTASRWIERNLTNAVFEPNDSGIWARITRELTAYFNDIFQQGALMGNTSREAFYIKCDADTNPPEVRDLGVVVTEIGLAPSLPNEFVVIHIAHGANGITITGPGRPL